MEVILLGRSIYRADLVDAWLLNFGGHGEGPNEAGDGLRCTTPRRKSAERLDRDWLHSRVTNNQLSRLVPFVE
jgi:hypothetical protein